ncbi:glycoside hydrolase family 95 protein [Anaerocolumna sedimenticola]|uniref:Glycoside hydrolase family 95 protein n=1 Tax=Anaerocolumna sedimenticola TaxID=2696063 RepID=A0A6P1TE67_9FIRM|nr:glycoside hydrolase family 95 protein [Anaerocolumna sedimenticola]QHQ59530.1 glycoside hydrolase family 95 protein [Anaerocolumna sedimenticola]
MAEHLKLWYDKPSEIWEDALPIGNGRIGGMVYGGTAHEIIKLNEDTLWSGCPKDKNNPEAFKYMEQARKAVMEGDIDKAQELTDRHMLGHWTESYLPFGNLYLDFELPGEVLQYRRELDLKSALAATQFCCGETVYKREVFVSKPAEVMVIHLAASVKNQLNVTISADSLLKHLVHDKDYNLILSGKAPFDCMPSYYQVEDPILYDDESCTETFEGCIHIQYTDGQISLIDRKLSIKNAAEAVVLVSLATSFTSYNQIPDGNPAEKNREYLKKLEGKTYQELLTDHRKDYNSLFNRMELNLGEGRDDIPTDKRILEFSKGTLDKGLYELFFQFNRYLLIAGSRPGTQAANLQGIWNQELRAPWSSNYTININTQMNYWLSETCNLSECTEPLIDFIKHLSENGEKTAKLHHNCSGWVSHHNSDIWAHTAPVGPRTPEEADCTGYSYWPMSSGWLCRHLWEHYLFTGDISFLKETALPILLKACRFYLDFLTEDADGHLVTGLSISPENSYKKDGNVYHLDKMPAMDIGILRELFTTTLQAVKRAELKNNIADEISEALDKLAYYRIGSGGQLLEYSREYEEVEVDHRHSSHLYCLYPSQEISPVKTPELAKACRVSLINRGSVGTGWGQAWKICLWARLLEGDRCLTMLKMIMRPAGTSDYNFSDGSGIYKNMFDAHPPFQIDGNFGAAAGIAEMFVQSEPGSISLLPALPAEFSDGYIKGLKCRGNITIDIWFKNHELEYALLSSEQEQTVDVMLQKKKQTVRLDSNTPVKICFSK